MKKILLNFYITVRYNQHNENESEICYDTCDYFNDEWTLKRCFEKIYKKYDIKIGREQKKCEKIKLDEYLWEDSKYKYWPEFEYNINEALNSKIRDLEECFNITNKKLEIWYIDGTGATSGEKEGIKFYFHTNEHQHHDRHIHCEYSGMEISINLDTLEVKGKPFRKNKMKIVLKYIKLNRKGLIEDWERAKKGLPFNYKMVF